MTSKQMICIFLILTLIIMNSILSHASSLEAALDENEGYWTETIEYFIPSQNIQDISLLSNTTSQGAKKTYNYKNSNGKILWTATLTATFQFVSGKSSTCDSFSITASSKVTEWKIAKKSASKSGNKATGSVTAKYYNANTVIRSVTKSPSLKCDIYGNIT